MTHSFRRARRSDGRHTLVRRTIYLGAMCTVLAAMSVLSGCASNRPDLRNPGTSQQQQMRATVHDPFGDNDVAPEIVGGRPRDYARQSPEPVRADRLRDIRWPF